MSELKVRTGTPEDIYGMIDIAMAACTENGFVKPNLERLAQELWSALNLDNGLVGIIGEPGGVIEGAILLRIGKMWYADEPILEEKAVFIHPDFRAAKGGRASRLCEFSKAAADSLGMPLIIGVLSDQRTEAKVRMYRRKFGEPSGAFFLYKARTGGWKEAAE